MRKLGHPRWFADFGGGFGRNAPHYRRRAHHSVIVDSSANNLTHAGELHAADIAAGRVHLVRGTVTALPFVDGAFDAAMVVRVLHHLDDVKQALCEMGRTINGSWLVDVPIKHHALGRLRSAVRLRLGEMSSPEPLIRGSSEHPFRAYRLPVIRQLLSEADWDSDLVASVNNFRRWDQALPQLVVAALRPLVQTLEIVTQSTGRGWWGPSQFLVATRRSDVRPLLGSTPAGLPTSMAELARRMVCPACRDALTWTADHARCGACLQTFRRQHSFWDFVPQG
ncbi:MAG TPA: class I SAM-dependent methyltransferase [Streptosporangiaceae bacterium]|jgi:ubiquinone/menaquinone biosynthesis C-methylase UbiE|nr:class I SAM-dependent methyltransferase [Streptosporangiaceae bacterium]